ncbi:MAG: PIG-L deacetylase family protein [Caldilineaceae bacterium]
MHSLKFGELRQVLCLGAHSDDIEIGCGGAVLQLVAANPGIEVHWIVFSANPARKAEALASASAFLEGVAQHNVVVHAFRDGYFPFVGDAVKDEFEAIRRKVSPDLIFTHCRHDLHQDHRLLCQLTYNTFRDHLILEYEIPKWDGDLRTPNVYFPLLNDTAQRKVDLLMQHFPSQAGRDWFTPDTFEALMRIRGLEARAPEGKAEGFYVRKLIL